MLKKHINNNDLILISISLFVCIVLFISYYFIFNDSDSSKCLIVETNGQQTSYSLDDNQTIKLDNKIIIKVNNKTVDVIYSPCKNQICVNHKTISEIGEQIVCLPLKTIISISGNDNTQPDDNQIDSITN